jgi:hypothetical protein
MYFGDLICSNKKMNNTNTSNQKYSFSAFALFFNTIRVLNAHRHKYYNINLKNTLLKINMCILMIIYVEMRLQRPTNSSQLKFCFNVFVNRFQRYLFHNGSKIS